MHKTLKKILEISFFFALTIVLLWFSFRDAKLAELWEGAKSASLSWIILSIALGIAAYFIRAQRWRLLIEPLGYKPTLGNMYNAVIVGYLGNFAFPRFGEIARCITLNRSSQIPFDKLVGTVVVERAFDMVCMITVVVVTFFLRVDTFGKFLHENLLQSLAGTEVLLCALLIAGVAVVATCCIVWFFRAELLQYALVKKIATFAKGIIAGLKTFIYMKQRRQFLLLTLALWTCYWLMTWTVLLAIPATASLGAVDGLVSMVLGSFGVIAPTSGGLGAFHAIMKLGLPFLFGISETSALLFATISHESQALFIVILGFIAYARVFIISSTKRVRLP
ncbi:MAG: flippase-like domain-containing protein [Prevotellaceae bacterium]|jgi:uncharacterized protein (TIRG00374 family)|nr:flippase-like domain-containing protein [Prevotellaceae bacterium]